jgi:Flp pilus assembly protein protease CpaA
MILDIARLLLFPALMAFAAASDLLTMTISNRVSLALAAGFLVLAILSGMGLYDILSHIAGQDWLLKLHAKDSGIPYGIALAIGALMIYPETEWIHAVDLAHFAVR